MGMAALGIGPNDEVIMADTNWIATASPIMQLGAKPVFVDILPDTWCLDPEKVEAAITSRTKAIVAVHLYGNLCDMDHLLAIGEKHGIPIIEDAAEAIGSVYYGKSAGSIGRFGAFSFHGTKTLTTGEGGMFVTNNAELYEKVLTLSNHGRSRSQAKQFWPDVIGFKYKMSNIQAAIGCAQMERIDDLIEGKRRVFGAYKSSFSGLPLKMNPEPEGIKNGYWMPTIVVDECIYFEREFVIEKFNEYNVDARVFFWPLSMLPMFEKKLENIISYGIYSRAINLPSYYDLKEEEIDRVVRLIKTLLTDVSC
jgi:perosamine synthetase